MIIRFGIWLTRLAIRLVSSFFLVIVLSLVTIKRLGCRTLGNKIKFD
jgi:hypothetical protein